MLFLSFILNLLATLCRRLEGINTVPNQTLLLVVIGHCSFVPSSGIFQRVRRHVPFSRSTNPDSHGDFAVL